MNVLSLFDGIAGARVALDRLGIQCTYYASEIDKYAISIAQRNYPDICQLGDVRLVNPFLLPEIDLLVGGSPCQDLSKASHNKEGLEGERSGLFFEYLRLLNYLKPKYFLLENVASMSKLSCWIISQYLGVEPIRINSSLVSAQQRERYYWTNIPGVIQPNDKCIYLKDIIESSVDMSYHIDMDNRNFIPIQNRSKDVEFLGAAVPDGHSGLWKGHTEYQLRTVKDRYRVYSTEKKSPTLKSSLNNIFYTGVVDRDKSYCLDANYYKGTTKDGYVNKKRRQVVYTDCIGGNFRMLTPLECERHQTFPCGYTEFGADGKYISNTQRYKALGNSFTVDVIAHILSFMG